MTAISANYREITASEAERLAVELADAWKDANIPMRQFQLAAGQELERFRRGDFCEPFSTLIRCLRRLPIVANTRDTTLLDAGASSGYYSEILKLAGFEFTYTGLDFSPAFKELAMQLYPGIDFAVADARRIPYLDHQFDIVLSSAVMMHCVDYEAVFAEAVRVSKTFVVLHRTPVFVGRPTSYFIKEAYGIPCLEVHFNESDLFNLFGKYGLSIIWQDEIFWDSNENFGHRSFVLLKDPIFHVQV